MIIDIAISKPRDMSYLIEKKQIKVNAPNATKEFTQTLLSECFFYQRWRM